MERDEDIGEQAPTLFATTDRRTIDSENQLVVETKEEEAGNYDTEEEEPEEEALSVADFLFYLLVCSPCLVCLVVAILLFAILRNEDKEPGYICHEPPTAQQVEFLQNNSVPLCLDVFYGDVRMNLAPLCLQQQQEEPSKEAPPSWCYANLDGINFLDYTSYYVTWDNAGWHVRSGPWDNVDAKTLYRYFTDTDSDTLLLPPDSSENITWEMRSCASVGRGPVSSCIYEETGRPISFRPCQTQNTTLIEARRGQGSDEDGTTHIEVPDVCVAPLKSTKNKLRNASFVLMIVFAVLVCCPLAFFCCLFLCQQVQ